MARRPFLRPVRRPRRAHGFVAGDRGQAVAEFALILPLIMILLMAIVEFALAFNAVLSIQRASTDAVSIAAMSADDPAADCQILAQVEEDVVAPNDRTKITQVQVQRTSPSGTTVHANNIYTRTGSTTCTVAGGTSVTVPYSASSTGYPPDQRCAAIAGCTTLTPARSTVDTIAVVIRYTYTYHTPLGQLLSLVGGDETTPTGWNFSKRNLSRIEPEL